MVKQRSSTLKMKIKKNGVLNHLHQALNHQIQTVYPENKNEDKNRGPNHSHEALNGQTRTFYPKNKKENKNKDPNCLHEVFVVKDG